MGGTLTFTPWQSGGQHYTRVRNAGHLRQLEVHCAPIWRRTSFGWAEAVPRFRQVGQEWVADEMVHMVRVRTAGAANGQIVLSHPYEGHTGTDHLQVWHFADVGLMDSRQVFTPLASMPVTAKPPILVNERRLRWIDYFPGIDLDLVIDLDRVAAIFTISDRGRALLLAHEVPHTLLAFRNRHGRAQLGHEWTSQTGRALDVSSALGTTTRETVCLRSDGRIKAVIRRGCLRHESDNPLPGRHLRVERDLVIRTTAGQAEIFEIVPWDFIRQAPPGNLILNATQTYQEGVSGYSGFNNVCIRNDQNEGELDDWPAGFRWGDYNEGSGSVLHSEIFQWTGLSIPGLTEVTAAKMTLTAIAGLTGTMTHSCYEVLRTVDYNGCNWVEYDDPADWTTPGCNGVGTDRDNTELFHDDDLSHVVQESGTFDLRFNAAGRAVVESWNNNENPSSLIYRWNSGTSVFQVCAGQAWETVSERPKLTIEFSANSSPNQPTCYVDGYGTDHAILRSSTFSDSDPGDTHLHSDWEIARQSDSVVVASSYDDTTHKTGITLWGLSAGTGYKARVRHTDQDEADSEWSEWVEFITLAESQVSNYPKWVFVASDGGHYYIVPDGKLT